MMGGGRELQGGREAMSERLTDVTADRRAYLESLREQDEGQHIESHRITLVAGITRYGSGDVGLSEVVSSLAYSFRTPGLSVRVSGGPLRFSSGDTLSIGGLSPVRAELDVALRPTDSLSMGVRAPSSPRTLDPSQVAAIESIGTSTLDLASIEFGTPARLSTDLSHAEPLGGSTVLSVNVGAAYEPRPSSDRMSYWRGTTLRGGVAASGRRGRVRLNARLDVTRSFSDSLGGGNLFQGGGTVLATAGIASLAGSGADLLLDVSVFYFRPYAVTRQDVSSRRDPVGDFGGASALMLWVLGDVYVAPSVVLSREASNRFVGRDELRGRGWSLAPTLAADVSLSRGLTFTPQVGFATGGVSTELIAMIAGMIERFEVSHELSGWWGEAALSWSF